MKGLYSLYQEEFEYTSLLYQNTGQNLISASMMTPTFADIDNDGDFDFFSGNVNGTVNYFNNIGIIDGLPVFDHTRTSISFRLSSSKKRILSTRILNLSEPEPLTGISTSVMFS